MSGRILIIGASGNMGERYRAILNHLGKGYICTDVGQTLGQVKKRAADAEAILIATPTDSHCDFIKALAPFKKPILCEKPISKNTLDVAEAIREVSKYNTPFSMVYQYGMLPDGKSGPTSYDYFRHGKDGLAWDCIQLIGLARSDIRLSEESPKWKCRLNGKEQSLSDMDGAYVDFIKSWFKKPKQDVGLLKALHLKTAEIEKKFDARNH